MVIDKNLCPACGFTLNFAPLDDNAPPYEICPCCGIQFDYTDAADDLEGRKKLHEEYREWWISQGMQWWSKGRVAPPNWDPKEQLKRIGVFL